MWSLKTEYHFLRMIYRGQLTSLPGPSLQGSCAHLLWSSSDLGCDKLLEVADGVVWITLYANLLSETVVTTEKGYQYKSIDNK